MSLITPTSTKLAAKEAQKDGRLTASEQRAIAVSYLGPAATLDAKSAQAFADKMGRSDLADYVGETRTTG